MRKIVVAVDGYSSCGKSTMAKALAKYAGYAYIDTGAMYRAIGLYATRKGFVNDGELDKDAIIGALDEIEIFFKPNAEGKNETYLNGENVEGEIRTLDAAIAASKVSEIKEVRAALVRQQQKMGEGKCVVMDGRDIGTVVFPNAELKIFVTASSDVRAKRRYDELVAKGDAPESLEKVKKDIEERDLRDTTRKESPLIQAADAVVLDNSDMTLEEQFEWLKRKFDETVGK